MLAACSGSELSPGDDTFRVHEDAGVTISESPGVPEYSGPIFLYEELFELEQDESRPETLLNVGAGYVMDESGQIFVFDYGDCRVAVFDQNGRYLRDFGRRGEGPGEFSYVRYSWMRDGVVAVYDVVQYRASLLTTDGGFIGSLTRAGSGPIMTVAPVMRMLRTIFPLPDGRIVHVFEEERGFRAEQQATRASATLVSPEGDSLRTFATAWLEHPTYRSPRGIPGRKSIMFTSVPQIQVDLDHGILIADPREPVLHWYGFDGDLKRVLRLGLEPEPVTREERDAIERHFHDMIENAVGRRRESFEETWENTVIPDHKSFWSTVPVDDYGFHWLRDYDDWTQPREARQWSHKVYNPEGEYLGSSTWPLHVASITRGHFVGRTLDEESGGYRYPVYRIRPAVEGLSYP